MADHHPGQEGRAQDPYKSEGERQIAYLLERLDIPFRYEYPIAVVDRGKVRLWYADFLLPEYGIVLEYAGMKGDSTYENTLQHKKAVYAELGLSALYIRPESFRGFWPRRLAQGIDDILTERLNTFRNKVSAEFCLHETENPGIPRAKAPKHKPGYAQARRALQARPGKPA